MCWVLLADMRFPGLGKSETHYAPLLQIKESGQNPVHYTTLNTVRFPLKLTKKVACLIQDVVSPRVVIKEWCDVARDVLCRTT